MIPMATFFTKGHENFYKNNKDDEEYLKTIKSGENDPVLMIGDDFMKVDINGEIYDNFHYGVYREDQADKLKAVSAYTEIKFNQYQPACLDPYVIIKPTGYSFNLLNLKNQNVIDELASTVINRYDGDINYVNTQDYKYLSKLYEVYKPQSDGNKSRRKLKKKLKKSRRKSADGQKKKKVVSRKKKVSRRKITK